MSDSGERKLDYDKEPGTVFEGQARSASSPGRKGEKPDLQIGVKYPTEKVFETCGQLRQHGICSK